jgi:predicted MFS family arabinose efflux permease
MVRTLLAVVCTFLNVPALMTVAPLVAQRESGHPADGGLVTAMFSGSTVCAELLMPTLIGRHRPGRLFAIALVLIASGSLAHVAFAPELPTMLALAAVRGLGFGTAVVTGAVLVAQLAPSAARGRAVGNLGLTIGIASMISPTLGLLLLDAVGARYVFAVTGLVALAGAWFVDPVDRWLPRPPTRTVQVAGGLRRPGLRAPVLALALMTMTYGGLVSFGPRILEPVGWGSAASFFFVYGAARAAARWWGGRAADRSGYRLVILPGMALVLLGLLLLTLSLSAAVVLTAGALYGAGSGMAQSGVFVGMLERVHPGEVPLVSTLWNMAFDGGVSVGGVLLGLLAASAGYDAVLRSLPPLALVALLVLALNWRRPVSRLAPIST